MDFAHTSETAPSLHPLPAMDCLADADNAQIPTPPEKAPASVRLRLPPYYVLQSGDAQPLGQKSN